jgi:hypothetical protein
MYVCMCVCMYVCMYECGFSSCNPVRPQDHTQSSPPYGDRARRRHTVQSAVWGQSETETQGFKQLMTLCAGLPAARGKILMEMYVIQNR